LFNNANPFERIPKETTVVLYVYLEEKGRKGTNNIASMLYNFLDKEQILKDKELGASLIILADNCSGHNKNNNTFLRLPLWLVERAFFLEVKAVFFIWGDTKNACNDVQYNEEKVVQE
jgi:hypothetical protein